MFFLNILKKILAELEQKHKFALKEAENKKIELFTSTKFPFIMLKTTETIIKKHHIKFNIFLPR